MNGTAPDVSLGPDLETIQTETLGFLSLAGDAKVRLTTGWSELPTSTSSLLSIASRRGLVAAAGPDHIGIATTESIRKAFENPKDGDSDVRSFEPQLKIPMSMRVSQLAFTADENYLVLSAESGGGLAVYEVQNLLQGSSNSAFELSTNGESLRSLIPNPTVEKAELCAVVTTAGNLCMANLKEKKLSNALKNQISCISWSSKGKQLIAGLGDGTIHQMTPEGGAKADIPKPPGLSDAHASSLLWLENNIFLSIHVTNESPPSSVYHIITRQGNDGPFSFQKLTDPVDPFGSEKIPHHSILRLRNFQPDLQDLLIVSSTASADVGLLSRSKSALASDKPVTGVFTTTELLDDSKRPTLPMTDSMDESTAVGFALDLSGKDKVYKPIPADDELEESPGPLPGLWILTHEGILCSWWVVYTDSIKQGTTYSGLAAVQGDQPATPAQAVASPSPFSNSGPSLFNGGGDASPSRPAFGASTQLGQKASPWAAAGPTSSPSTTGGATFGSSTFGSASPNAAFGKPSTIGFGQSSQLGSRASPWGSAAGSAAGGSAPVFGQTVFGGALSQSTQSPFGSAATNAPPPTTSNAGGFAGFASKGGFASLAGNSGGPSVFGTGGKPSGSLFGSGSSDTAFPPKQDKPSGSIFGSSQNASSGSVFGSTPFKLQSSFKPDPLAKDDGERTPAGPGASLFGSTFGSALNDAGNKPADSGPSAKDDDMDTGEPVQEVPQVESKPAPSVQSPESTTPTTTPAPSRFGLVASTTPPTSSLFGQPSKPTTGSSGLFGTKLDTPKPGGGGLFGSVSETPKTGGPTGLFGSTSGTPKPGPAASLFGSAETPKPSGTGVFGSLGSTPKPAGASGLFGSLGSTPKAKEEKKVEPETPASKDEVPLPPDITSRTSLPIGESSSSSATSTAPSLFGNTATTKPDSIFSSASGSTTKPNVPDEAPLPPDYLKTYKATETSRSSDFVKIQKPSEKLIVSEDAPLPPDFLKTTKPSSLAESPLPHEPAKTSLFSKPTSAAPPSFILPKAPSKLSSDLTAGPVEDADSDLEDNASEGSGIDVAKDLSPSTSGLVPTPGFTPQSSFGGIGGPSPSIVRLEQDRARPLFGELSRNAPLIPRPSAPSPRSPSPIRGAIPNRVIRSDATRSVSAPGMASQILGPKKSQLGTSVLSREKQESEDAFLAQHRRLRERQQAEEGQLLVDKEDDEVQRVLASDVQGTLDLDEFIAHANVAPPAKESIPAQVEAVYRDINSMIDTLGLNARTVKSFTKGHIENRVPDGRAKEDLEDADDWVLCEVSDLGEIIDTELYGDLEDGRVQDLSDKLDACQDLAKDMQRLRAKQEDLKRVIMTRMDPSQADISRSLPLSAEQQAQQNELRREYANFTKALTEAEEALTLLKTRIASLSAGKPNSAVPTVEAVMKTITKMTSMVEKRSGDVDVLETQLRKIRLESPSREGSPLRTPQARRSILLSPDSTPARNMRHSLSASVMSLGASVQATPPRKKLSGFSKEEKGGLMDKKAKRQAILDKLKESVQKRGVSVWNMEDIE